MIPDPDPPIGPVNPRFVNPSDELHRIHPSIYRAAEFNPCKGIPTRFAPILDNTGNCIPTIYAASTLDSVCFETIFHNALFKKTTRRIPIQENQEKSYTIVTPKRSIKCAQLFNPDLALLGLNRDKLIASPPTSYSRTAAWAKVIHDQYKDIEGLIWTSGQCDPDLCFIFFGDRLRENCFNELSPTIPLTRHAGLFQKVRSIGMRADILITTNK